MVISHDVVRNYWTLHSIIISQYKQGKKYCCLHSFYKFAFSKYAYYETKFAHAWYSMLHNFCQIWCFIQTPTFLSLKSLVEVFSSYLHSQIGIRFNFFMLALLFEYILLATFYGLYFNHQFFLHITIYNFSYIHHVPERRTE